MTITCASHTPLGVELQRLLQGSSNGDDKRRQRKRGGACLSVARFPASDGRQQINLDSGRQASDAGNDDQNDASTLHLLICPSQAGNVYTLMLTEHLCLCPPLVTSRQVPQKESSVGSQSERQGSGVKGEREVLADCQVAGE